jgi:hypothetical protein
MSAKTMNLPELYRKLLDEYEQVLRMSEMILAELKRQGAEDDVRPLLERKRKTGENIARLTEQIASTQIKGPSGSDLSMVTSMKHLLRQITEKAELLQKIEGRIQDHLQRKD